MYVVHYFHISFMLHRVPEYMIPPYLSQVVGGQEHFNIKPRPIIAAFSSHYSISIVISGYIFALLVSKRIFIFCIFYLYSNPSNSTIKSLIPHKCVKGRAVIEIKRFIFISGIFNFNF